MKNYLPLLILAILISGCTIHSNDFCGDALCSGEENPETCPEDCVIPEVPDLNKPIKEIIPIDAAPPEIDFPEDLGDVNAEVAVEEEKIVEKFSKSTPLKASVRYRKLEVFRLV